jgi:thiamine monophosphate kinase
MVNELSGEERLIARYFRPLAKHPAALGLFDDAAALEPPAGCDTLLKTDGLISGVHFSPMIPRMPWPRRPCVSIFLISLPKAPAH